MSNTMVPYDTAGVMRCCIQSLDHFILANPIDMPEGTIVMCEYEFSELRGFMLQGGRWRHHTFQGQKGLVWRAWQ